jgi:hypothetical protein
MLFGAECTGSPLVKGWWGGRFGRIEIESRLAGALGGNPLREAEASVDFPKVVEVVEDRPGVGFDVLELGELVFHAVADALGENPAERSVRGAAAEAEGKVTGVADVPGEALAGMVAARVASVEERP